MKEISVNELLLNPYDKIHREWMLITAGTKENGYNTMTASWGEIGSLWNQAVTTVFIRPQRYTKQFADREDYYTLCFFSPEYKKALAYLGSKSGRDEDKVAAVGLTPVFEDGYTYFAEANLVLVCKKLYQAPIEEKFFKDEQALEHDYPERDFHDLYIGGIRKVLVAEADA